MGSNMCYIQGGPVEIQTLTHWNLTGRSKTAPPPVSSPNSILPPLLYHCALILSRKKSGARFKKCYPSRFFLISFKLHVSSCVAQGVPAYLFVLHFCNFVTGSVQTKETHMSDITSKFHIIATPVTVDIQALTHTHSLSYTHIHSV